MTEGPALTQSQLSVRQQSLLDAQNKAEELFSEIERSQMIRAGVSEKHLNSEIYQLAQEMFGIKKFWHKRIVRAGKNTLCPYRENPPDLEIKDDDILFLDFGPIFEDWEADLGRTYVLGNEPSKLKLKLDVEKAWSLGQIYFEQNEGISAAELFGYVSGLAAAYGWKFGQEHCGHLIGNFPHENIRRDEACNFIHPDNKTIMRENGPDGIPRNWILEVHFIDPVEEIGGFFEQLLY